MTGHLLRAGEGMAGVWLGGSAWQHPAELTLGLEPTGRLLALGESMAAYSPHVLQAVTWQARTQQPAARQRSTSQPRPRAEWASALTRGQSDGWRCVLAPLEAAAASIAAEA